jgi:hypothetical protein
MKTLIIVAASIAAYSQATVNAPAVTLDANGTAALTAWMAGQTTGVSSKLTTGISAVAVTLTVENAQGIGPAAAIVIDSEHLQVTAKSGNVLTVTRGANGTTPAIHATDAQVSELKYKTFNALGKAIIVDAMRAVVRQQRQAAINAAVTQANAETEAAVQ